MPDAVIRRTPGRTNVSRAQFVATLRAMHAAKWGHRPAIPLAPPPPEPEPPEVEERRLTTAEVAEVERLRQERASYWTWKRLGERYGTTGYAVKMSVLGMERVA